MSFRTAVIKPIISIVILALASCGCASSYSTLRTNDPSLRSRFYNAPYSKVVDAVVEAASKTRNWKVQEIDEEQNLIMVVDEDGWRRYVIKIYVKEMPDNRVRVDAVCATGGDIVMANKEFLMEFLAKLDNILK